MRKQLTKDMVKFSEEQLKTFTYKKLHRLLDTFYTEELQEEYNEYYSLILKIKVDCVDNPSRNSGPSAQDIQNYNDNAGGEF